MKKSIFLLALLAFVGKGLYAQSSDQNTSEATPEQNRFEATVICIDAVEAPTKYNAFAKEFINIPSFPKKTKENPKDAFKKAINAWLLANPTMAKKILMARKKAHDKLYGPRPY